MVLSLELFKTPEGIEMIRKSEYSRKKNKQQVDKNIEEIVTVDEEYRKSQYNYDGCARIINKIRKEIGAKNKALKKGKKEDNKEIDSLEEQHYDFDKMELEEISDEFIKKLNIQQLIDLTKVIDEKKKEYEFNYTSLIEERNDLLKLFGNIVHQSVPISFDEKDNTVLRKWGNFEPKKYSHVELIEMIGGVNLKAGSTVAGNRGYYLTGPGVYLAQALQRLAMELLTVKNYEPVQPPLFMNRDVMSEVAQLSQFDDELYRVENSDERESKHDKYLIATSEQPIAALHRGQRFYKKNLPIKYMGISNCFRKEAGRHGHDTLGIFRVHQFEKIEQFIICSPEDNDSWNSLEEMVENAEIFLQTLEIPYQVVNIISGELNDAASKKIDIEGWFAGGENNGNFRELVSCSNCTDFQSRNLGIRYDKNAHVHMLNGTLCAVTRMICVLLENHQTDNGIKIPKGLQRYMPDKYSEFISFI